MEKHNRPSLPPPGFAGPLVQRQITPEILDDLRVETAEGKLNLHDIEHDITDGGPLANFTLQELLSGDENAWKNAAQCQGVAGNFWQRKP